MDLDLAGRVAIVTGASRGLGRSAVKALANEGAKVLAVARSEHDLQSLQSEHPDQVSIAVCDMEDLAAVSMLPDIAVERYGRIDIVVNNAGIAPAGSFVDQDDDLWQRVFTINVFAPVTLTRRAGHYFLRQRSGKVINIASTSGILGKPILVAYSASKGALVQQTKALGAEWAKHGVQVNAIAPGAYETAAQDAVLSSEELLNRRLRKIPANRFGQTDEIGPLVCLLASPWSDFMSGSIVVTDGGESSKL